MTVLSSRRFHDQLSAPWLVWLHGLWGKKEEWSSSIDALPQYPSLVIDLPGHGDSVSVIANGFADVNTQLKATLAANEIHDYWLMGYSLGGRLAMYHATHGSPNGLRGLMIEAGNPGLITPDERNVRILHDNRWAQRLREDPLSDVLSDWYRQDVFADLNNVQRQQRVAMHMHHNAFAIADMLANTSLGHQPYLVDKIKQLTIPYLYICGERDTKFCKLAAQHQFPLRTIPQVGHNAHLANTSEFVAVLRTFLFSHSG